MSVPGCCEEALGSIILLPTKGHEGGSYEFFRPIRTLAVEATRTTAHTWPANKQNTNNSCPTPLVSA